MLPRERDNYQVNQTLRLQICILIGFHLAWVIRSRLSDCGYHELNIAIDFQSASVLRWRPLKKVDKHLPKANLAVKESTDGKSPYAYFEKIRPSIAWSCKRLHTDSRQRLAASGREN